MKKNNYKNIKQKNHGITLIALVITIIVLLILVAVVINTLFDDNGILVQSTKAKELQDIAGEQERLELIKADVALDNQGKVKLNDFLDKLYKESVTTQEDTTDLSTTEGTNSSEENIKNKVEILTDTGFAVELMQKGNDVIISVVGKKEKSLPIISNIECSSTTNFIDVYVTEKRYGDETYQTEYTYYYKADGEEDYSSIKSNYSYYRINGVRADTNYTIKVEATNKYGTSIIETRVRTWEMPSAEEAITCFFFWKNLDIGRTTNYLDLSSSSFNSGYDLVYKINGGNWTTLRRYYYR